MTKDELKAAGWEPRFAFYARGDYSITVEKDGPYFMRRRLRGPGVCVEGPFVKITSRTIGQDFEALGSQPMPGTDMTVREWALTPVTP